MPPSCTGDWILLFLNKEIPGIIWVYQTQESVRCSLHIIQNISLLADRIELERSIRQGFPLPPTIFALYIEFLAQSFREDCRIQGIMVNNREHKIAFYADDVLLYILCPAGSP